MADTVLRVENLQAYFFTAEGTVKAVNDVSFDLHEGRTLALVGESGAGKTSVGLAIVKLLPHPGRVVGGRVLFGERDLTRLGPEEMRQVRGREIAMIFQDPVGGLNPVLSVGAQVQEIITTHLDVSSGEARQRSLRILAQTGLADPEAVSSRYPFQLSGGMAQRVMIAIATALNPRVIIADEPTSALDVTVQAGILEDLQELQRRHGTAILLITHDLGIVAQTADDMAVMYAGRIVETGDVRSVFSRPRHPYTWALLNSRPRLDLERDKPLPTIAGTPPSLVDLPPECPYLPRCPKAVSRCRTEPMPPLTEAAAGQRAACYNPVFHHDDGA
ncbi:MAG: ABC transporter ATP-binding protein [Chloroflexi bacterium]|nr:ABC transporter ATP-binding protein [Chloroflexota bacterium]